MRSMLGRSVATSSDTTPRGGALVAIASGIWVGGLAGLATALADYGAHWLYMESARDRLTLLLRLIGLQAPAGALLGAALGGVLGLAQPALERLQRRWTRATLARLRAALLALLAAPLCAWVAQLLFSGGKMSRIPFQSGLRALAVLALIALFGAAVLAAQSTLQRARSRPRLRALQLAAAGAGLACAIAKLDQHVLPNLYDYLHGVLSVATWASFGLAFGIPIARAWDAGTLGRRFVAVALALGALVAGLGRLSLASLDANQNVRVALANANMPHSRSLLFALQPLLPRVDAASAELARQRAAAARLRRSQRHDASRLPVLDDAHVLLISVDALRADHLGLMGYARPVTPELDALAARGVVFEHAYAQAPHSSYSLCSLMTSEYLHETLELGLPPPRTTLPRVLAASGYHTAAFYTEGIFHTAGERLHVYEADAFGFALHDHQDRPAEQMTDRVLTEIDRTLQRGEPSALFWAHYFDVHEPYEASTFGTSDVDRYDSELLAADAAIGRLVREATQRLTKPLIVAITADHGEEFHEHGGVYHGSSLYEEQVHVPLLFVVPGVEPRRESSPVESVDLAPSLLALLGIERPPGMRGVDLRPALIGPSSEHRPVFSAVIHKKMVVQWPHKLIADLRFGSFELYDLERDPGERDNRADADPARVQALRGEIYAWLDSLSPTSAVDQEALALEWGRLGDRRAVQPLAELLLREAAPTEQRREAARLLGKLADESISANLLAATRSPDRWVAAEAAIALGRMFDPRAGAMLRRLVAAEDPGIRSRAAVSLGRLRDSAAVPALIDALWSAPNDYEREEAVRWLGRLRDVRALDPLMNLLPETRTRHLVVVALGELGDARAFAPLSHVLAWERNTNVRDGAVRGLALLDDPRALDVLLPLVGDDVALRNVSEALVRLRALPKRVIGGADVEAHARGLAGFGHCESGPIRHDWDFQHRTSCETVREKAALALAVPPSVAQAEHGTIALLGVKRIDGSAPATLTVQLGAQALTPIRVDSGWSEYRWVLPKGALVEGTLKAQLSGRPPTARFKVDHFLLIPGTPNTAPPGHGG